MALEKVPAGQLEHIRDDVEYLPAEQARHFEPFLPSHPDPAPQQFDGVARIPSLHATGREPLEHLAAHDWPLFRVILQVPLLRRDVLSD